jgi:sulfur-carrier protein
MVRVILPFHLRTLAKVDREVLVDVPGAVSVASVLEAVERSYPVLRGTIREHDTLKRRAFLRFFAAGEDISFDAADAELPASIASGQEPLMVVGAIAGG